MNPTSPTDIVPPPSYQISQEEFDQKSPHEADEDGWPHYDAAAYEAVAENHERSPPSSSSARVLSSDTTNRHESRRRGHRSSRKMLPSAPLKIRTVTSERNSQPEQEEERRVASPPPPFTPNGPSLDGPPFNEVDGSSDHGHRPDSTATPILEPYPPSPRSPSPPRRVLPPVKPLQLRPNRLQSSQLQTSSNPHSSHSISPRSNPTSTIARVEFDPQTAYSPYGGGGVNHTIHTHIRADATAFYNHAVASQLTAGSAVTAQTQPGYMERVSSPYSGGYAPTRWSQQATPSVSFHEQYAPHVHNLHLGIPAVPPASPLQTGVGHARSPPPGAFRGSLPPAPDSLSQRRWAGSEQQIVEDVYRGQYGNHG